jgi:hypothetical protein
LWNICGAGCDEFQSGGNIKMFGNEYLRGVVALVCLLVSAPALIGQSGNQPDIYQAYRNGQIEIDIHGDGIEHVSGKVSRTAGARPMIVRIPAGTLFIPNGSGVQNMVVTQGTSVNLLASRSASFRAAVACTDIHRSVPTGADRFEVGELPEQKKDVLKLFPVAAKAGASYEVEQAGIWIVTDDANYNGLGILTSGPSFLGARAIREQEAASAMMLLDKAGLDVSSRSIWRDRRPICEAALIDMNTNPLGPEFCKDDPSSDYCSSRKNVLTWCSNILQEATDFRWKLSSLESPLPAFRDVARRGILSARDDDARAALINTLNMSANLPDFKVAVIAEALGNFRGPEVTNSLIPLLTDHPTQIRVTAIQSITKTQDVNAAESVRPLLSPKEPSQVRLAAIRCLGALGSTDEDLRALKEVTGGSLQSEAAQAIRKVAARKLAFR